MDLGEGDSAFLSDGQQEIKDLEELTEVMNEINGISFTTVRTIGNSKVDYR